MSAPRSTVKSKLKFILPLLALTALGGAYKVILAAPDAEPVPKIEGDLYVLPKEFLVNLEAGRYAKVTVALRFPHGVVDPGAEEAGAEAAKPPEGFGILPQEAFVRAIVTDTLSGSDAAGVLRKSGRETLRARILRRIQRTTDVEAEDVFFTDVAVQ